VKRARQAIRQALTDTSHTRGCDALILQRHSNINLEVLLASRQMQEKVCGARLASKCKDTEQTGVTMMHHNDVYTSFSILRHDVYVVVYWQSDVVALILDAKERANVESVRYIIMLQDVSSWSLPSGVSMTYHMTFKLQAI